MTDDDSLRGPPRSVSGTSEPSIEKRTCGTCFACCVFSGVEALSTEDRIGLRTYPGQTCVHINRDQPAKSCSVYNRRPLACEKFQCAWLQGLGSPIDRPDQSGIMVSIYPDPEGDPLIPDNATITITDGAKCGELDDSTMPLRRWVDCLTTLLDLRDLRIVNYQTRTVVHLLNGLIYMGKLHKAKSPEELSFDHSANGGLPIGKFELQERKETVQ